MRLEPWGVDRAGRLNRTKQYMNVYWPGTSQTPNTLSQYAVTNTMTQSNFGRKDLFHFTP